MYDLDKDGDGVLDYSEFLAASVNKHQLISKENLRTAFNMLDADKNG
jgi:Ca2+-binding EF-hand superfamily protein